MKYVYYFMYSLFLAAAFVAVAEQSALDDWMSLITNGALAVTGFYAYSMERFDLAIITTFGLCTSLVWHSSGKYKDLDGLASRYMAYYAFGTSALSPSVIGPAVLFLSVLLTYNEQIDETYVFAPLLAILIVYRWVKETLTQNIILAVLTGTLAILCYRNTAWHSMWHVLGAITVGLTIEPPLRQTRFYMDNTGDMYKYSTVYIQ
tara:strand:- start:5 stop:619 length:615 start_codon:yes stop_codon:yes gene_type:complete